MPGSTTSTAIADRPLLQLHLEPDAPLEVSELTASLGSLARRYAAFVEADETLGEASEARLLVWSVAPGSIDIAFLPDLPAAAGIFALMMDPLDFIKRFGESLKIFLDLFRKKSSREQGPSVRECNDAVNIAAPIANHGGTQTITVINGNVTFPVLTISASEAREMISVAQEYKQHAQQPGRDVRQRVPLVWDQLDRNRSKVGGRTPDRALIEEIDPRPRPVFFTDEMAFLKDQMINDEQNPYRLVYFVDVEVSQTQGRIVSYRVIAFHGKDSLE